MEIIWRIGEKTDHAGERGSVMLNKIMLMGRLVRDWTDKDGGRRRSAEVVADNIYFGDSKRAVSDSDTHPAGEITEIPEGEEGELPF